MNLHIPAIAQAIILFAVTMFINCAWRKESVDETPQTTFTYRACPDCIVMHVNYIPPKP